MSDTIKHIDVVHAEGFSIPEVNLALLYEDYGHQQLPEINVFDQYIGKRAESGRIHINDGFWWGGAWSANSYHVLKEVLACFDGEADLVIFWGGGFLTSLRLRDHTVTSHEVVMTLGEQLP